MAKVAYASLSARSRRIYRGWWLVAVGFLSQMVAVGASGWVFSVLIAPMEDGLGWDRVEIVGVLTLSSVISGVLAAMLGPLVDRHGTRILMTASAVLGGACLMLVGRAESPWQYYLAWAGFGVALPGLMTLGPGAAIANWFIRKRALAFTAYTFGSATAGIVLAPVMARVAEQAGWRTAWFAMGCLLWAVAPLAWLTVRRRPEDVGLLPDGEAAGLHSVGPPDHAATGSLSPDEPEWTVRAALRTPSFWLLTGAFTLTALPASSIYVHMAPYVASKGFSLGAAATALSIYGFGVLGGRPLWGFLLTRLGMHRTLITFGFTYGLGIAAFLLPSSLAGIYAMTVLLGLSIAGSQQLQAQAYPDYFGRRIVGTLLGYAGIALMVSRATAPLFAAYVYDTTRSYGIAFGAFAVACLIAGAVFLLAAPPRARRPAMASVEA